MKFLQVFCLGIAALANSVGAQHQQLATEWLAQDGFPNDANNPVIKLIRYGLACFYFATYNVGSAYTDAAPWTVSDKWVTDASYCEWYGVTCDEDGLPSQISLNGNNIGGLFPQELTIIAPGLKHLDLGDNPIASVAGDLSWIGSLTELVYLDLYFCNMDYYGIPPYFSELKKLEHLDISYCFFYGEIDGEPFKNMNQLTYLDIGGNYFEGDAVPTQIAKLPKLETLLVDYSGFGGDLSWISLLNIGMFELWGDDNNFDGGFPAAIGDLKALVSLSFTGCSLTGALPTELGELEFMQQMWFYNNSFTGNIPDEFAALSFLKTFQTEDNMLDGDMPDGLCDLVEAGSLDQLSSDCLNNGQNGVRCPCCQCCEAPCFEKTAAFFCFPGHSLVEVLDKGTLRMDQLKIGDNVHVGDGKFSKVYSFGHYNQDEAGEYLQLFGSDLSLPLEITKDHMVFIEERGAVPARNVKLGDNLVLTDGTSTVTKISTVNRVGAYAPFTHSGMIAVNDVVASSYVSLQEGSEYLMAGDVKLFNMHWIAHVLQAPHRIVCNLNANFCAKETYTEEGISNWVNSPLLAAQWLVEQNAALIAVISIPVVLIAGVFFVAESIFMNAGLFALAVASFAFVTRRGGIKKSV